MSVQVMDTGDGDWNSKVDSLCAMFPDQPRSTIDSVLINNNGNTESAANQLIDVNTANTDVQGLIQEETTVLANIKKEKDQSSLASGPINPILHPRLHRRAAPSQQASQSHQLLVQSNNNFNLVGAVKSVSFSDYSQQYRLGNEPTRKRFLDSYKHFMDNNKITPIWRIPVADMINKIPLDFYKLYQEVCGRNGMLVVNQKRLWGEIASTLNLKDDLNFINFLKKQYIKYLYAYECKHKQSLNQDHGCPTRKLITNVYDKAASIQYGPTYTSNNPIPAKRPISSTSRSATSSNATTNVVNLGPSLNVPNGGAPSTAPSKTSGLRATPSTPAIPRSIYYIQSDILYRPFSLQYQLNSLPDHAAFLDTYQRFCAAQGYPCSEVPVVDFVNYVNFDLYQMYMKVVEQGGYHDVNSQPTEREENLIWKEIIKKALNLVADKLSLKSVKNFYKKYLLDFEIYYRGATHFPSTASGSGSLKRNSTDKALPRNKHKKNRVSGDNAVDGSQVAEPDSTTPHYLPILNSASSSLVSDVTSSSNIPNIPPNVPPMLLLSTAGMFDQTIQSKDGSLTHLLNSQDPSTSQGVEDAFQDYLDDNNKQPILDGDVETTLAADELAVLTARNVAYEKLAKAQKESKETSVLFNLTPLDQGDPEYDRLTDKAKIFFNLFSNSTVEINEMYKVQCPANRVHFYEKAANLTVTSKTVELYKSFHLIPFHLLSEEKIYKILKENIEGRLFSLYKYAKTETEGNLTFVVCDALLGQNIDISDKVDIAEEPIPFVVSYKNQIMLKYVVTLKATKIAAVRKSNPYSDVPDVLAQLNDGVWQINVKTFDFRNASDPWCDVVMKATSLYNGDCVKRQTLRCNKSHKKEISHLEIVVSHGIWKKYEAQKHKMASSGGKEIYAYHATSPQNVQSIAQDNLDWQRAAVHGRAHGNGCYFSEYPEFSLKYNRQCMLIFKLILLPNQYNRVKPDKQGYCEQIIMWDNTLFKPVYVLYF